MRTRAEVDRAVAEVRACGLPPHKDPPKNWDLLVALGVILERTTVSGSILEMGATQYSKLLPWLYLKGISTGQFEDTLKVLLGPDAPGLLAA